MNLNDQKSLRQKESHFQLRLAEYQDRKGIPAAIEVENFVADRIHTVDSLKEKGEIYQQALEKMRE